MSKSSAFQNDSHRSCSDVCFLGLGLNFGNIVAECLSARDCSEAWNPSSMSCPLLPVYSVYSVPIDLGFLLCHLTAPWSDLSARQIPREDLEIQSSI